MHDWNEAFLATARVPQPVCAVPGTHKICRGGLAGAQLLETAQDYTAGYGVSKENDGASPNARPITECILCGAADCRDRI